MDGNDRTKLGRRALLAAGVAAATVHALAAPTVVRAADGDALKIGDTNAGSKETVLNAPSSNGFRAVSAAGDALTGASAAAGKTGVLGYNAHASGNAVWGHNTASGARGGLGSGNRGVYGLCSAAQGAGVRGESSRSDACAVEGYNSDLRTSGYLGGEMAGAAGDSPTMFPGVGGTNPHATGPGVLGTNIVRGTSGGLGAGDYGVWGYAPLDLDHHGLFVEGRVHFNRTGMLTIAKDKSSVSAAVPALSAQTTVLATLQTNRAGVYIQAALASPASGKITVYLNKKVTAATKVAYFVLG